MIYCHFHLFDIYVFHLLRVFVTIYSVFFFLHTKIDVFQIFVRFDPVSRYLQMYHFDIFYFVATLKIKRNNEVLH